MSKIFIKIFVITFLLMSLVGAETLQKFEISGNKRISDQTIIIFSELKINDEITKGKLDKVIKKLYQSNFFYSCIDFWLSSRLRKIVNIFI